LIIKLGAIGDALRTTPILPALRKEYAQSHITWVTDTSSYEVLDGIPSIDRLFVLNFDSRLILEAEVFDRLYCFDKSPLATALAAHIRASHKKGFCMTPSGTLGIYDQDSLYALRLGLSDPFKFFESNRTYQDVLFEMAGLRHQGEQYQFALTRRDRSEALRILQSLGWKSDRPTIGLNTGCGQVFSTKEWGTSAFIKLAKLIQQEWDANLLLLGGKAEKEKNQEIERACNVPVLQPGGDNPVKVFAALLESCDVIVTGDTLAMHLAIALERPVVALFGSTCPQEIDLYDNGVKLFAEVECSPCYRHKCDSMQCMDSLHERKVLEACEQILRKDYGPFQRSSQDKTSRTLGGKKSTEVCPPGV
jgi:heptosyltransferase-2